MSENIRNIAIIAHVDHGKTTLVDQLLQQSGTLQNRSQPQERMMDSGDLEKERGITILAKNTAVQWGDYRINLVDTPGHADFGGEVERILSMVDSVLLLVDAVEGPMPQTRFVSQKAFALGLNPIVVINKMDRDGARPNWVLDATFDLFDSLGANEEQLDFPVIYASGVQGKAGRTVEALEDNLDCLFKTIVEQVPPPRVSQDGPLQLQVSALDYSNYLGVIGIGRLHRGQVRQNQSIRLIDREGRERSGRILKLFDFMGLERREITQASAGDIVAFCGIDELRISDTLCDPKQVEALPPLSVDEPTVSMSFQVNTSPFAGRDGKFVTSRKLQERLEQELLHNVALRVSPTEDPDKFKVSGRGELHLSILIETLRREGYELAISRPEVIDKQEGEQTLEPFEILTLDVEQSHQGAVIERLGIRQGQLKAMQNNPDGRVRLDYMIPSRGLIGFRSEFLTITSGTGIMHHQFDHYGVKQKGRIAPRQNGVLIANGMGKCLGYALFNLQNRGRLFVSPGDEVYEGMLVGIHSRSNDLDVNPLKAKQLTNIRASGSDENILLEPPIKMSLEQAIEFIEDDELVEVTPNAIRLRKKLLTLQERKRASRFDK